MSSCEKPSLEADGPNATAASSDQQVKEKKGNGKNPFSVANMREAYANLVAASQPCLDCPTTDPVDPPVLDPAPIVEATHLYVRFKPANTDQIADLDDLGYRLSWVPYDESVAAVTTVNYDSDEIPWIYTVVPTETSLPGHIQHEEIDQLFLFTTEDGDLQDGDPWQPDPREPCQQWDPRCNCYVRCTTTLQSTAVSGAASKTDKPSKQKEAANKLKKARISPKALYEEAMRISGNGDEVATLTQSSPTQPTTQSLFGNTRYHPRGRIRVQDQLIGEVPLRGVKVESRRWFNLDRTYTDGQGNFSIGSGYLSLVKISLEFKNDLATTRGIISGFHPWQAVLPINTDLADYKYSAIENIAYTVTFQGGADKGKSKGASTWTAATLFNTLADSHAFAAARGLPGPAKGINIWLLPDFPRLAGGYGSTPMLRKIAETSLASNFVTFALAGSGLPQLALVKVVLQRQLPDVTIWYNDTQGALPTDRLVPLFFHELAHAQHYVQVGNPFWTDYVQYIIGHLGYGRKSDEGSGRIAISEGWGNYIERLYTADKYRGTTTAGNDLANLSLAQLENQVPSDTGSGWLVYGMYHDMTDGGTEPFFTGVTDNITAYTPATVFRGLTSISTSVGQYKTMTLILSNRLQEPQLNQLVTTYRW